jgi:hypothetical protein
LYSFLPVGMADTFPWIKNGRARLHKLADITADHHQVLQSGYGGDKQIRLTEDVSALLACNHQGLPAHKHGLRDGENPAGEERAKRSFQPQMQIGTTGSIAKSLNAVGDFRQRYIGDE